MIGDILGGYEVNLNQHDFHSLETLLRSSHLDENSKISIVKQNTLSGDPQFSIRIEAKNSFLGERAVSFILPLAKGPIFEEYDKNNDKNIRILQFIKSIIAPNHSVEEVNKVLHGLEQKILDNSKFKEQAETKSLSIRDIKVTLNELKVISNLKNESKQS